MSEKAGVSHDTMARLLDMAPSDLEKLVQAGSIRRNDRNNYSVPVAIAGYVALLKAQASGTAGHPKQDEVGMHVDLSDRSVREWELKLNLSDSYTLSDFRIAYIRRLREEAAGRAADGELDLAGERARLAKEQADRVSMQNAVTRRELAPAYLIEEVLAKAGARASKILDTIPGMIKRRVPALTSADINAIAEEIAKARNIAAAVSLSNLDEPVDGPEPEVEELDPVAAED